MDFHLAERPPVAEAIEVATAAKTLEQLYAGIKNYEGHEYAQSQPFTPPQQTGIENPIMIAAEKPEEQDLETGRPYSGEYGNIMRQAAKLVGVNLDNTHIAYAIHWITGDKSPNKTQIAASRPLIFKEIELVRPRAIMAQGKAVMESLLGYRGSVLEVAGNIMGIKFDDGFFVPVFCATHPAYCLHNGQHFESFTTDMRNFFAEYGKAEEQTAPGSYEPTPDVAIDKPFTSLEDMKKRKAA